MKSFHKIGFDVMFVGSDWKGDPLWVELESELAKYDARIEYFQYTDSVSSSKFTELLQSIQDGNQFL